MTFYQSCLGGELSFQTVGDSPLSPDMPGKMKDVILHATLRNGELILQASDMVGEKGLRKGNAVSLLYNCSNEALARDVYDRLSASGEKTHPLTLTMQGELMGDLTDQYGNNWIIYCETNI